MIRKKSSSSSSSSSVKSGTVAAAATGSSSSVTKSSSSTKSVRTIPLRSGYSTAEEKAVYVAQFVGVGGVRSTGGGRSVQVDRLGEATEFVSALASPVTVTRRVSRKRYNEAMGIDPSKPAVTGDEEADAAAAAEAAAEAAAAAAAAAKKRKKPMKWRVVNASNKHKERAKHVPWNLRDSREPNPQQFEGTMETGLASSRYVVFISDEDPGSVGQASASTGFRVVPVESWLKFRKRVPPVNPLSLDDAEAEMEKRVKIPDRYLAVLANKTDALDAEEEKKQARAAAAAIVADAPPLVWTDAAPDSGDDDDDDGPSGRQKRQRKRETIDTAKFERERERADAQTNEMFDFDQSFSDDDEEDRLGGGPGDGDGEDGMTAESVIRSQLRAAGFDDGANGGGGDDDDGLNDGGRHMKKLLEQEERGEVGLDEQEDKDQKLAATGDPDAKLRLLKRVRDRNQPLPLPLPSSLHRVAVLDAIRARGLCTMTELIAHFKPILKGDAIAMFSKIVKEVAKIVVFEGRKYIQLRSM